MYLLYCCLIQTLFAENIYLYTNESIDLSAYKYFSGTNLTILSSSPHVSISATPKLYKLDDRSYSIPANQSDMYFQILSVGQFNYTYYVANNVGSTIFVYSFDFYTQRLLDAGQIEFNETIQETYLWTNKNKDYLLVLTKSDVNFVFLIEISEVPKIIPYDFWDLRYVNGLRSSEILLGQFIPFIGNLNNQGIFWIYDFGDPYMPTPIFTYTNPSFRNAIDMSLAVGRENLYQYFILCQNFGLIRLSYYSKTETFNVTTLNIKNVTFTDLSISFSVKTLSITNLECIVIGSSAGMIAVNITDMSEMFLIKTENNQSLCSSYLYQSLFLITQKNLNLIVVNNSGSDRNVVYEIDVHEVIEDFNKSKWHIGQWPDGNFILVSSNSNNLVLYNLSLSLPTITINVNDSNYLASVTDKINSVSFNVSVIKNLNEIYYLDRYHDPYTLKPNLEVLFQGFTSSLRIDPEKILAGRNLSFEFDLSQFENSTFGLTHGSFDKLLYMNTIKLDFSNKRILISNQSLFLIQDTKIEEYSVTNFTVLKLISKHEYGKIFKVVEKDLNRIIFSYQNKSDYHIWVNNSYSFSTLSPCEYLETILTYIVCGTKNNVFVFNLTDTFEYSLIETLTHNYEIKDIAVWSNKNIAMLLILDANNLIYYIFLQYLKSSSIKEVESVYDIKKIISSGNTLFAITDYKLFVYTYDFIFKTFDVPYKDYEIFCLGTFAYLYEPNNRSLTIVDVYRGKIDAFFLETDMELGCSLISVGFYNYKAWILQGCSGNSLKIYISECPSFGDAKQCVFNLPFEVQIKNTKNLSSGSYKIFFSVIGRNSFNQSLPFTVNLNLIVYGQAVVAQNDSLKDFSNTEYNYHNSLDLLEVFSGNNMEFSMQVTTKKNKPVNEICPYQLVQRFESEVIYSSNLAILGLSSIPFKNILLFSDENNILIIYNTTKNQISYLSGLKELNLRLVNCPVVEFLFEIDPYIYVAILCNLVQKNIKMYYNGKLNTINTDPTFGLVVLKFNIKNMELAKYDVYELDIQVSSIQHVYDGSSKVSILLISKISQQTDNVYLNNELEVYNFEFYKNELRLNSFLKIDYRSLKLNRLYITAVNGIILKILFLVVVDKHVGIRILKLSNSEVINYSELKHKSDDFFTSVAITYKQLNIITSTAKVLVYNWNKNLTLTYYSTRYPYTINSTDIYSIPSKVTYETFFYNNFLVFSVLYDNNKTYFRILDNNSIYSSSLIQDVEFIRPNNGIFDSHIEFTDNMTSYFISNLNEINRIRLNEPKFIKKKMTKTEYDEMVDKYGGNEFIVNITAKNENNYDTTGSSICKVAGQPDNSNSSSASNSNWLIGILSISLLIILIISVVLVYKCVFKKKQKLEFPKPNLELTVNYSFYQ